MSSRNENALVGIVAALVTILTLGCAGAKISSSNVRTARSTVKSIAMAPSGGVLADAIAVELFNRGFQVVDTAQTSSLLVRLNLSELEILQPESLARLRKSGIDAMLSARSVAGYDGRPQSASVRVNSTHSGEILAGLTWQNGWGGYPGSPADRTMRADLSDAAAEIAEEITTRLSPR